MDLLITNGRVIDPANSVDEVRDVAIRNGVFIEPAEIGNPEKRERLAHSGDLEIIDAGGLVVTPGLIDMHVHLREPGQSAKETVATGTRAAAAGGFTTVVAMPNTQPRADSPSTVQWIIDRAEATAAVNVFPTGTITKNMEGEQLAPIGLMHQAGIVAITDDGHCVQNHEVMRRATEYARMFDLAVLDHCQDYSLVGEGIMHEGFWSTSLGLPGWPAAGEVLIVMRNALLAEICEHRIHCQHMTSAGSIRVLREARSRGIPISGEVCPHHIALTDECLRHFDSNYKMNPPLRTEQDIQGLLEGIADGTITILGSDHAPHCYFEKEVEIDHAPFGIIGLETELGLFLDILLHERKVIDLPRIIQMLTQAPADLLNLDRGTLSAGRPGDVTLIDPDLEWTYDVHKSWSLATNTPFHGRQMKGRAVRTIVGGSTVWKLGDEPAETGEHEKTEDF